MPKRKKFKHIESHRDTNFSSRAFYRLIAVKKISLIFIDIKAIIRGFFSYRSLTAVSCNISFAIAKSINSKTAVIVTKSAIGGNNLMEEAIQSLTLYNSAFSLTLAFIHSIESRTISTHKTGNTRADNLSACFLFKYSKNRIIKKCSALNNNFLSKLTC